MNRNTHIVAGSAAGIAAYVTGSIELGEEPNLFEGLLAALVGGYFGALPDILEPATSPRHRAFFHSVVFISLAGYVFYRIINEDRLLTNTQKKFVVAAGAGYGSHLVLDRSTPAGLPLLNSSL